MGQVSTREDLQERLDEADLCISDHIPPAEDAPRRKAKPDYAEPHAWNTPPPEPSPSSRETRTVTVERGSRDWGRIRWGIQEKKRPYAEIQAEERLAKQQKLERKELARKALQARKARRRKRS
jgi:hypothetical protein